MWPVGISRELMGDVPAIVIETTLRSEKKHPLTFFIHSFIHFISQNTSYIKTTWKINVLKVFHRTRIVLFRSNRIFESNRPYTTQAVTQPNGLQAYRTACYRPIICWRLALWTCVTNESGVPTTELRTEPCLFQFSHKTRQTMLLYAYFTPKVDFKRKFNHHQPFLYEWRLTARTIRKFRIGPSIRIESRIGRTIRNRIEPRSFAGP